ncbi:MAG: acyl-CoA dehydratase activase-related protein [Bacillota bacterium]|jgi:predicted nucleotide-binding protein (sugar kinase/HSP70/actin superfamily)
MKITFPHMGNQYVATKTLLQELGVEVVIPPQSGPDTINIGTKYSPESICFPLKVNIGNIMQAIQAGADTVVFSGSCGPCRFGYYTILQKEILKDLGQKIDFILIDPPQGDYKTLLERGRKLTQTSNPYKLIKAGQKSLKILKQIDALDAAARYKRPRQKELGQVDAYYEDFHKKVRNTHGYQETSQLIAKTHQAIMDIEEDPKREILKVGIVGEIYTIIEPFVNLYIERKLGEMGVEIEKSLELSRWIKEHAFLNPLKLTSQGKINKAAKPYLKTLIGGHARETIGYAVEYAKRGFDGLIQIYPLTCMPEIVAQSILPAIEKDYHIPYLCLIVDEMTGEAGFTTRLEAFTDLLRRRKEKQQSEKLLSWY